MNNSKHAPGPWSIDTEYNTIIDVDESDVVQLYPEDVSDEAAANARLIAAAPELLEALKSLNERLTDLNSRGLLPNDKKLNTLIRESFDLTEKATGGEE